MGILGESRHLERVVPNYFQLSFADLDYEATVTEDYLKELMKQGDEERKLEQTMWATFA